MDYLSNNEFKEYLKNKTCRGCSNHCLLLEPNCNRSKIFIKDEYENICKTINVDKLKKVYIFQKFC